MRPVMGGAGALAALRSPDSAPIESGSGCEGARAGAVRAAGVAGATAATAALPQPPPPPPPPLPPESVRRGPGRRDHGRWNAPLRASLKRRLTETVRCSGDDAVVLPLWCGASPLGAGESSAATAPLPRPQPGAAAGLPLLGSSTRRGSAPPAAAALPEPPDACKAPLLAVGPALR
jgi:hypothetical protein